jgi:hypothetical protein
MSEVMSSSDIEDVLSSIRRLVTGDLRPRTSTDAGDEAGIASHAVPDPVQPPPGRLLLTPALRVVPSSAPSSEPRPPIDGVLSLIGARVEPPGAGFEAETGDAFDASAEARPPRPVATVAVASSGGAAGPRHDPAPVVPEAGAAAVSLGGHVAPEAAAAAEDSDDDDDDDAPAPVVDLDEDTLRELIRDVLREELQGQMGERITRNIRKLVRAELARAVTLRNID